MSRIIIKYCECGCNAILPNVNRGERFIKQHHNIGKHRTIETRMKISKARKGFKLSDETKNKISNTHKMRGIIPPSRKGIKSSKEHREKISKALKGIKRPPMTEDHKKKLSKAGMGYKHPEWRNRNKSIRLRGENSHFWKGGVTEQGLLIRNSLKYKEWRFNVFKNNNFTCQICGDNRGRNLNAHHLKSFSILLEEIRAEMPVLSLYDGAMNYEPLWNINNGITLCDNCHKENQYKQVIINKSFNGKVWSEMPR